MAAGNEWINGYLEAILDAGGASLRNPKNNVRNGVKLMKLSKFEEMTTAASDEKDTNESTTVAATITDKLFSPTTYFVEEVINGFDESDLHRTWVKVTATRNSRARSNRLENLCWRIWHLARRKKQIAWEDAQKLATRRVEREQGRNDVADDLSELSEGEKEHGDANIPPESTAKESDSASQIWTDEEQPRNLYIVLISLHGLVRGENMELGRDSDTGGQVKYVVELARALANTSGVYRVDLLTRQITSPEIDSSYGEPIEMLSYPLDGSGSCGAYIIRIPCGPPDKYIPKESLWPYVPEFIDGALNHIVNMARALGEQLNNGGPTWPYVIHGHYADAGEVAAHLSGALEVPMVLTGHSLGRNKLEQLLKQGRLSREDIDTTYNIVRRIEAEEFALDAAQMVVTSTRQEIEEQWGLYDGFDVRLERKLRVRRRRGVSCMGRYIPRMVVIPPGMDFSYVTARDPSEDDLKSLVGPDKTPKNVQIPLIWSEIMRFFTNPHKPTILALSRPDPKKNVTTLIKAFGENQSLRELANLTLILGNRDDIEDMSTTPSAVLTTVLKLIDKYDLYGQVAYPKHHKQSQVPDIYRLAAKTKGVFVNPALVEPFGLTLIEAAAYGLPIVATENGGPVDILKALNNGILVDPHDQKAITDALLKLLADKNRWNECRKNGLKNIHNFSWPEHCRNYLSHVEHCRNIHRPNTHLEITYMPQEPLSESLREAEDQSLRFSVEEEFLKCSAEMKHKKLIEAITTLTAPPLNINSSYSPGRRQMLFVIAADCYNCDGNPTCRMQDIVKNTLNQGSSKVGFVLLTGLSLAETMEMLRSCLVNIQDFDAIVCKSGGEMYYPWKDMAADTDYEAHVEYRWPGANIKPMVIKLARDDDDNDDEVIVELDEAASGSGCYSYNIKPGAKIQNVDNLRQRLRMRGFRCNLVYTRAATRLNVVPLFASRVQAMRYLSIRWGIDLSNVVVVVGERGDTDYEQLLGGLHKTLVIRGSVEHDSTKLLNDQGKDLAVFDGRNVRFIDDCDQAQHITTALEALGVR